jgi:hypothetical protein
MRATRASACRTLRGMVDGLWIALRTWEGSPQKSRGANLWRLENRAETLVSTGVTVADGAVELEY